MADLFLLHVLATWGKKTVALDLGKTKQQQQQKRTPVIQPCAATK